MSDSQSLAARAHRLSTLVSRRRGAPHEDEDDLSAAPAPQPQPSAPPLSAPPPEPGGRLSDYFAALGIEDAYPDATQAAAPPPSENFDIDLASGPFMDDDLNDSLLSTTDGLTDPVTAATEPVAEKPLDDTVLASFDSGDAAAAPMGKAAGAAAEVGANRLSYTFDEEFTDVIRQVAEHMECDPADIITTAVNFYISELYRDAETDAA